MTINLFNKHAVNSASDSGSDLDHHSTVKSGHSATLFPESAVAEPLRPQFWTRFALAELNHSEWEALCDGCGSCCLIKYIDHDDDEELVEYTDVTCQLMDCATGYCQHYATRQEHVPDCIQLTMENLPNMMWLPSHCAYKRLYKGQNLPSWHLLLTGDVVATQQQMRAANIGVAGRCVSEIGMSDEEMEERVVNWVKP
ncbi:MULTISPECIES: YcgN family cysteine cluster protein [Psychrobacter]|uniref:YcgN family cysteine cluster protein n=1 Tax=Psychrobacter TaxID=497 RepID=UPI000ECD8B11|nr:MULTISPECIES: YcgN family cysteine cluster protein [Psychrobacter]HCN16960.1 YcgN family cysteine cluster protein [Psychrobacter sp.]